MFTFIKKIFLVISFISIMFAQEGQKKSGFVSVNSGLFITFFDNFSKTYDSPIGAVIGAELGLPLTPGKYLFFKATYFSKSGVPVIKHYSFINGQAILTNETREGEANFKQWIFNGGMLFTFYQNPSWEVGFNGGLTYSFVREKETFNSVGPSEMNISSWGFFVGGDFERKITGRLCMFLQPQFNYMLNGGDLIDAQLGGLNCTAGLRYFFKDRD